MAPLCAENAWYFRCAAPAADRVANEAHVLGCCYRGKRSTLCSFGPVEMERWDRGCCTAPGFLDRLLVLITPLPGRQAVPA